MKRIKEAMEMKHWQFVAGILIAYDAITIALSFFLAIYMRFDFHLELMLDEFGPALLRFLPPYILCSLMIYFGFRLYHSIWQFASYVEMQKAIYSVLCCTIPMALITFFWSGRLPISVYLMGGILQFACCCAVRFSYRFVLLLESVKKSNQISAKKTMIIGAGAAGQMLAREASYSGLQICAFIDDNPNKHGRNIDQIPVVGGRERILETVQNLGIEMILVAIPSASMSQRRDLLTICQETDCDVRVLPSLIHLSSPRVQMNNLQKVKMSDLLGRDPIQVDTDEVLKSIAQKTILITGGGGSIGSELCRQIAAHNPNQLIILDIYENNAYAIQQELLRKYPDLNLKVVIASVRDAMKMEQVFEKYRPQLVYHAAAHKHVPLMETSPCEAIKNNVFGTYNVARAAKKYGAERFLLISTDKAVNPTNIMGASKRLCEMVIQSLTEKDKTQFVAVRFGNVLGSNGSVIPLFKKQIEEGGPVTVTHPDIIRYFMTIEEAVSLVLEAGSYAKGGEIFVLDMGECVKIDDLAKNMIRLAGLKPNVDIQIRYTGLRPGEKLYEEKLMAEEGLEKTKNKLIHIGKPISFDHHAFLDSLPELYQIAIHNQETETIEMVRELVHTYSPDWKHFEIEGIEKAKETDCFKWYPEKEKDLVPAV